jgi:triacylglycerol lipase
VNIMDTRHLVDPALAAFLDAPPLALSQETLPAMREGLKQLYASVLGEGDKTVSVAEHLIPGPVGAPDVRLYVYTPPGPKTARPALFHIHGGGYVLGDAAMMTPLSQVRARAFDCVVVSVDYRLCPETAYPGPVEDCYAGLSWMVAHAAELGIDPSRIVVGGESAGGGLSAALCLLARDRGGPAVALQFLIYPMLDHRTATPADPYGDAFTGEFAWTRASNRFGWSAMLGDLDPAGQVPAYCSPSRAASLAGLPPAFIAVGALDLFLDEDVDYATRLIRAGVPTELHVYPGAFHAFDAVASAPVAIQFQEDCTRALKRAFAG